MDIALIFQKYIPEYLRRFGRKIPYNHLKTINDILRCRTPALGGEVYYCENCKKYHYSYHSCKNRHCPKCGGDNSAKWLEKQKLKLLPVMYFMVTFTLPEELRSICRSNQKVFYSVLFQAASWALRTMLKDPKFAGGEAGFTAVLHSWTRQLVYHPHVHFIVPDGAFDLERNSWNKAHHKFLIPVKALSKLYRMRFENILNSKSPELYKKIPQDIWKEKKFITNSISVGKGATAFTYLSNYVYRTAISNNRIISCNNGRVTFRYKDSQSGQQKLCSVDALEFIRRFLQHTLPVGFQKVRYYGFLNSVAKSKWEKVKLYWGIKTDEKEIEEKSNVKPGKVLCLHCSHEMVLRFSILRKPRAPPELLLQKYVPSSKKQING